VVIRGNEVIGSGGSASEHAFAFGIAVVQADAIIENNVIEDASQSLALVGPSSSSIANNTIRKCNFVCVRLTGTTGVDISGNRIEGDATRNTAGGILAELGAEHAIAITGNEIVGLDDPQDPANPEHYPIDTAILVLAGSLASGEISAPVTVSNNLIRNAHKGIAASLGGVVAGRDNRLESVHQGLTSFDGASNSIRFSDFTGAFIGLNGDASFAATCNYWGGSLPPNVPDHISGTAYIPYSETPIAGTEATDCEPIG
jgi:hypothetical protein